MHQTLTGRIVQPPPALTDNPEYNQEFWSLDRTANSQITTIKVSELNFSLHVYSQEFTIEGLLGITLDNDNVFLVNINETVRYEEEDEEEDMLRQPQIKVRATVIQFKRVEVGLTGKFNMYVRRWGAI